MPSVRHVSVKERDVLLLVGTMKGAFVLRSNAARERWQVGGPYFSGMEVYAMAYDGRRGRRRIWAAPGSAHWGTSLASTDDFGKNWTQPDKNAIRFDEASGASVKRVWQLRPGRDEQPDTMYAGVEPGSLFESHDNGATWSLNEGLWNHPHRPKWQPGGGGLCLHTIVLDPSRKGRMWIAVSAAGVYRTDDGGRTWHAKNKGIRAEFMPDNYPEFGQCVHKIGMHAAHPERLFVQNHGGLYRSDDAGDTWHDIANGVPSDFGFPIVVHPHDPETVYAVPLESAMFRCTPEGRLRVYRTRDGGAKWEALTNGLPQQNALETVVRDAMDTDPLNPAGIYFGTRSGTVWGSADGGAKWGEVLTGLPPVVCVKAYVVGDASRVTVPRPRARAKAAKKAAPRRKAASRKKAPPRRKTAARAKAKRPVTRKKSVRGKKK